MMERLDTLIAFAVVMLGVSLLITILTQMVSAALGLRGSSLLWGLETLFQELAPDLEAAGIRPGDLAKEVLQSHLISDSTFSRVEKMKIIGPFVGFLMKLPLVGWLIGRWRYASAIRLEELVRMLQRKAVALGAAGHAAAPSLTGLLSAAEPAATRRLQMLNTALADISPPAAGAVANYAVQVDRVVQEAVDSTQLSIGKLETWFDSTMDRVSQRFAMETRIWTVVFAFLISFGAHLDSLQLLDQLSSNPDTRAALVNQRDGMLGQAKQILPSTGVTPGTAVTVSHDVLTQALEQLKTTDPAVKGVGAIPDGVSTIPDAVTWLTQQPGVTAEAGDKFRQAVLAVLHARIDKINTKLANAGFQILPADYREILKFDGLRNVLGVLLTAGFLSLGAPFWYNTLKDVSNLRSVVATNEANESTS
jgi:hypothetical protein